MLDSSIIEQLKVHFANLQSDYVFSVSPSEHSSQTELLSLLNSLTAASPKLKVVEQGPPVPEIQFSIMKDGTPTGIRFHAVPGGHEFTSLVLAILNADGKGKLPDEGVIRRVKALKGPIDLRTFVSLTCTNCPDVVQALNQLALLHGDFRHTTIDGAIATDEATKLGIQAVPTVFAGDRLVHVGKSTLSELLEILEESFGTVDAAEASHTEKRVYDVVVVGGGPAGISAAIYSARKGLRTALVAQKVGGQVQETLGIENLVSVTYTEGPKLAADLVNHLKAYPVDLLEHRRVERIVNGESKEIVLKGGEVLATSALIMATGAKWRELGIPGEKEYLGRGVAFCPHCDGPFYKGQHVAVIGGGNSGVEAAIDLAGICSHVTLIEFLDVLKADAVLQRKLKSLNNVDIVTNARATEIVGTGTNVTGIKYRDRSTDEEKLLGLAGVFVQIGLVPNSAIAKDVVDTNRFGEIIVDAKCRTSAPGIYAAGDVTTVPFKQIVIAMGEGAKAALSAFEDRMLAG